MSASIRPTQSSIQIAKNLNLSLDVQRDFGASGSGFTTTGSITAGSSSLTLANAGDFRNGQEIAIVHAGSGPYQSGTTTALVAPTSPVITNEGTAGTTTYTYYIAATDENGGITSTVSVSTTTGNATLSQAGSYNYLTWTASAGAWGYAIWGDASNPATSQGFLGLAGPTKFLDMGLGPSGMGLGQNFTASDVFPASYPTTALGDTLSTTIQSGASTTTLTIADAAANAVTSALVLHDDTSPLTNALTAVINAGGGTLDFGDGTFYTRGGLTATLTSAIALQFKGKQNGGSGQIIALPGYTGSVLDITGDSSFETRVIVQGLVIDGNKANNPFGINEDVQCGIRIVNASHCLIEGNTARNTWMSPIRFGNGTGATGSSISPVYKSIISHNVVYEGYDQGIAVWNSSRITVEGNVCTRTGWAGISFTQSDRCTATANTSSDNAYLVNYPNGEGHGVALEGADNCTLVGNTCEGNNAEAIHVASGPFTSVYTTNCTIADNTARTSQMQAMGINITQCDAVTVCGNTLSANTGNGIAIANSATNIVVEGNTCRNNQSDQISVSGVAGTPSNFTIHGNVVEFADNSDAINGIILNSVSNSVVADNIVQGYSNAQGIILLSCDQIACHDNVVTKWNGNANIDARGVTNSNFHHNIVQNAQGHPGILFEDNGTVYCVNNTVEGNVLIDTQSTPTQTYGFQESGSTDYSTVRGNRFSGNVDGALALIGAHSTAADNVGYNPVGLLAAPSIPATGTALTNTFGVAARYYVSGGAVTNIAINGTDTGLISGAFLLEPLETITFDYTTAPALVVEGL